MVSTLQRFISAERMSNWKLHLQTVRCHISQHLVIHAMQSLHTYTCKSCYVCQKLIQMRIGNSWKYTMWCDVRSERFWAGLSPDPIIEQVLMRSIKTHGGVSRGKGMTEKQRLVLVLYMPVCTHQ